MTMEINPKYIPVNYHAFADIVDNGKEAVYLWRLSRQAGYECAKHLTEVYSKHYNENRFDPNGTIDEMAEAYGLERVRFMIALTVRVNKWDGRLQRSTFEWANSVLEGATIVVGEDNMPYDLANGSIHMCLLDCLAQTFKDEYEEKFQKAK